MKKENKIILVIVIGLALIVLPNLGLFSSIDNPSAIYCNTFGTYTFGNCMLNSGFSYQALDLFCTCALLSEQGNYCTYFNKVNVDCSKLGEATIECTKDSDCGLPNKCNNRICVVQQCAKDSDCTTSCFPQICSNSMCLPDTSKNQTPQNQPCENATWKGYPSCSWETSKCNQVITNDCIYKISDFCIKVWMILALVGVIILIIFFKG